MRLAKIGAVAVWCVVNSACAGMLPPSDADRAKETNAEIEALTRQQRESEEKKEALDSKNAQVEGQKIIDDSRARRQEQDRVRACAPAWRASEIKKAEDARLRSKVDDRAHPAGIPNSASERHKTFERYAKTLEKQTAAGCDVASRADFEVEWAYLQQEEAGRVAKLQEREAQAAREQAERDAQRATFEEQTTRTARKKGFERVEFGRSLVEVLQALIEEAAPVATLRKVAIEVGVADEDFLALQSLGKGQGIFTSSGSDVRLWVIAPGASIYKGTGLTVLVSEEMPFFTVTGTKSYKSVSGALTQAFVVKPSW